MTVTEREGALPATGPFGAPPANKHDLEESDRLTPRFGADGLVTAVVSDAADGEILMLAHMSAEALERTIETGIAHFHSRSRGTLWKKGETSGNLLRVVEARVDCDQDAIWLRVTVEGDGVACHTGRRSCFYRAIARDGERTVLEITDKA